MDMTYNDRLKRVQSGCQAQEYHFWANCVNHTGSVKDFIFSNEQCNFIFSNEQ